MKPFQSLRASALFAVLALATVHPTADTITQPVPFTQNWTNTGLITTNNDWSGVPGIVGYSGIGLTAVTGADPQTLLAPGTLALNVLADQTAPNSLSTGGVAEFHLANPTIALNGSGTANAPHLVLSVNTTGTFNVRVAYQLRDLDGSADNAVSPIALQYRIGDTGNYVNVPAGFVADASEGGTATKVTAVDAALPEDAQNAPLIQIRIITADAAGSDEWIGIDDIAVTGLPTPIPTNPAGLGSATPSIVSLGANTLLAVQVSAGLNPASTGVSVTADLSSIGGAANQPFFDDASHGDAVAGDNRFSFLATVDPATPPGGTVIPATIADGEDRSGFATISLNVFVPITSVTISQVYGGGGNAGATYTHDFVELYNRSAFAVDLAGWSVQYASSAGVTWQTTPLAGVMQPGTHFLVQEAAGAGGTQALPVPDSIGSIAMAATAGKVALVAAGGALSGACAQGPAVVDFVGYGAANCFEGTAPAPAPGNASADIRLGGGGTDTNNNAADFSVGAPTPRNSGSRPIGVGSATPAFVDSGDTSLLRVTVTPGAFPTSTGLSVTADLTSTSPTGAASQPFYDDGTHGDVTAGDLVFSFSAVISGTEGAKTITATVNDVEGRSSQTVFAVTIQPAPIAIHSIQGPGSQSGYVGQVVSTTGIVTAIRSSSFYIQVPDGQDDGDPNTSEGLLVFRAPVGLSVGDFVRVTGRVVEFVPSADAQSPPITELANDSNVAVLAAAQPLPQPVTLLPSLTLPGGDFEQLERFEGMRVRADITAVSGTSAFRRTEAEEAAATSVSNGDFFAVITGVPRPMREPGLEPDQPIPAGSPCCIPFFDGNPERLRVDSDGQSGGQRIEIVAGQTIAGLVGVLDYGFRSYTIVPDPQPWIPGGRGTALAVPEPSANEFTVAAFNMERFFDTVDDPAIDDAVLTPAAFETRLAKASLTIRNVLRMPDILGVEEVENVSALETLAARINTDAVTAGQGSPLYQARLFEGNDPGGIDSGVLVKTARVDIVSATQEGKTATYTTPANVQALLNDRPPVVVVADIRKDGASPFRVTVIVNHLRSLSGIDGSDAARIRAKRRAQAEFLANLIQQRQGANPADRIISIGDYNAFPFNDGYVDVVGTIKGEPTPADQVVLASADLVDPNLTSLGDTLADERYSFVFDGNAQALDHILVNSAARARFSRMQYARVNADFPESLRGNATRPERLSDHDVPVAFFTLPGAPVVTLNGTSPMTVEAATTFTDPGAIAVDEELGTWTVAGVGTVNTFVVGTYTLTYTATNGFLTTSVTRIVNVVDTTAPVITLSGGSPITLEAGSPWIDPGATASDTRAGDLTAAIVVSGAVNNTVVGPNTILYAVTDGYNTATATRVVNVVDTTAPTLSNIVATPSVIATVNHKMVDVTLQYTATDVTGTPSCSVGVTSNEPINGPDDGNTNVDWQVLDATHVRVRAERSGSGTGRLYTLTVTCRDGSGNAATKAASVLVPK